jgi:hypothetical protein
VAGSSNHVEETSSVTPSLLTIKIKTKKISSFFLFETSQGNVKVGCLSTEGFTHEK